MVKSSSEENGKEIMNRRVRKRIRRYVVLALTMTGLLTEMAVLAEPEPEPAFEPDYQVKLLLDPTRVLDENGELLDLWKERFQISSEIQRIGVMYLDTPNRDLQQEGWLIRIRKKEDKKKLELSFKKRYPIPDGNTDPVLFQALADGFIPTDKTFSSEYDWGLLNMTLTLEYAKKISGTGSKDVQLPDLETAIELAKQTMPEKMKNWKYENWGSGTVDNATVAGPVVYTKQTGMYCGQEINLEIWPIFDKRIDETVWITELWFKTDSNETAQNLREMLVTELKSNGILLENSTLKTESVLNAFLGE